MKWSVIVYFSCCMCSSKGFAQPHAPYGAVEYKMAAMPDSSSCRPSTIAAYIQSKFTEPAQKIAAAYYWITASIRYDRKVLYYRHWSDDAEIHLDTVLKKRRGVCEDYAGLFTSILLRCSIPAQVVSGYTKNGMAVNRAGHSWCAVLADDKWWLCDPAWDAGNLYNPVYFLVPPQQFIETHMPFDPLWQLLPQPINHRQFYGGNRYDKNNPPPYNVNDSVASFFRLDTLAQLEAASYRIKQAGIETEDLKTWYTYHQMKVAIVQQENDMILYNKAVAELNSAKQLYNQFVQHRNNHFIPEQSSEKIYGLFDSIAKKLSAAYYSMNATGKKMENYQYDTGELKEHLDNLSEKVKEQRDFFYRYQSAVPAEKENFFYK